VTLKPGITVAIASIPPRVHLLQRAMASVLLQTHPAVGLAVAIDHQKQGAAATRQRALDMVDTEWVAFLDDDDEFMPNHLATLWDAAQAYQADYVYSWFETIPYGCDPFPITHYLDPWDDKKPRQTTVTTMVRTELAREVGFASFAETGELIDGQRHGEDWTFTLGCLARGAKIHHVVAKTWWWHHDSGNTSGRADRW
jgi:glycosyltransferase involved in cell wall biosynthesis